MSDEASEGEFEERKDCTSPPAKRARRKEAQPRQGFAPEVTEAEATQLVKEALAKKLEKSQQGDGSLMPLVALLSDEQFRLDRSPDAPVALVWTCPLDKAELSLRGHFGYHLRHLMKSVSLPPCPPYPLSHQSRIHIQWSH